MSIDHRLRPIADLEVGVRAYHGLRNAGCELIGDATLLSKNDLFRIPNVGKTSIMEIKDALAALGLSLSIRDRFQYGQPYYELTDVDRNSARQVWSNEPPKAETIGVRISGHEADFLLYALDAYADTDVRGRVHNHHHKGYNLEFVQQLRDKLFAAHDHPVSINPKKKDYPDHA